MNGIEISSRSWHYRLYNFLRTFFSDDYGPMKAVRGERGAYQPKSLCSYFWTTVLMFFGIPFLLFGIALVFAIIYGIIVPVEWIKERRAERRYIKRMGQEDEPPKPSLVISFVRARKSKVCPRIIVRYPS